VALEADGSEWASDESGDFVIRACTEEAEFVGLPPFVSRLDVRNFQGEAFGYNSGWVAAKFAG